MNKFNLYEDNVIESGKSVKVSATLRPNYNEIQDILDEFLAKDIKTELSDLIKQENEAYEILKADLKKWAEIANQISVHQMAQEYLEVCDYVEKMTTTENEWIKEKRALTYRTSYYILSNSNKTYSMTIYLYEDEPYHVGTMPTMYYLELQGVKHGETIQSVKNKKFKTKEEAEKYISGRQKYYNKYFTELYPPVPRKYQNLFCCNGKLIKGYRIE